MTDKSPPTKNNFIIDSELFPLFKKAEKGCYDSILDLADAFAHGNGAKVDYELASKYEEMLLNKTDDNHVNVTVLWNKAIYHRSKGNYLLMEEQFKVVVEFMLKNIPISEWRFEWFSMIEELMEEAQNEVL